MIQLHSCTTSIYAKLTKYRAQILMNRVPEDQYDYLDQHPRHVMIPHRLMAYPADVSAPRDESPVATRTSLM